MSLREYLKEFDNFEAVTRHFGTSYYLATLFFPRDVQQATFTIYTWVRIPDEIVDNPDIESDEQRIVLLSEFTDLWKEAYKNKSSEYRILFETTQIFHQYNIPYEESELFLDAMKTDLTKERYENYDELERYMDGSASAVGVMMSYILGFEDGALSYARELGYAMQLTNFLRDLEEDIELRNRIYLPQNMMRTHNITDADIKNKNADKLRPLIVELADKNRDLYEHSLLGVFMLRRGRLAVTVAAFLYRGILDSIAAQNYNPFAGRAYTRRRDKIVLIIKSFWYLWTQKPKKLVEQTTKK